MTHSMCLIEWVFLWVKKMKTKILFIIIALVMVNSSLALAAGDNTTPPAVPSAPATHDSTELPVVNNPGTVVVATNPDTHTMTLTANDLISVMQFKTANVGSDATLEILLPTDDSGDARLDRYRQTPFGKGC